jgi:hypothetical protein
LRKTTGLALVLGSALQFLAVSLLTAGDKKNCSATTNMACMPMFVANEPNGTSLVNESFIRELQIRREGSQTHQGKFS